MNQNRKLKDLKEGDRVYVRKIRKIEKLGQRYSGPFRINKVLGVVCWVEELATGKTAQVHMDRIKHSHDISIEDAYNVNEMYPLGENKDDSIFLTAEADNEQLTSSMNEAAAANDEVVESEAAVTSERGAESTRRGKHGNNVPTPHSDQLLAGSNSRGFKVNAKTKPQNSRYPLRSKGRIKP